MCRTLVPSPGPKKESEYWEGRVSLGSVVSGDQGKYILKCSLEAREVFYILERGLEKQLEVEREAGIRNIPLEV